MCRGPIVPSVTGLLRFVLALSFAPRDRVRRREHESVLRAARVVPARTRCRVRIVRALACRVESRSRRVVRFRPGLVRSVISSGVIRPMLLRQVRLPVSVVRQSPRATVRVRVRLRVRVLARVLVLPVRPRLPHVLHLSVRRVVLLRVVRPRLRRVVVRAAVRPRRASRSRRARARSRSQSRRVRLEALALVDVVVARN